MTDNANTLTTAEYAERSGLSVSTVTRMLRTGTLNGEKRSGKWVIFDDGGDARQADTRTAPEKPLAPAAGASAKQADGNTCSIEAFARLTYLTEKGVRRFLADGRLTGGVDQNGQTVVDAANLQRPEIKHLIRP